MQVSRNDTVLECPLCGRTLLLGERVARYRAGTRQMLVCELCVDDADTRGWLREGAPVPPPVAEPLHRGSRRFSRLLGHRKAEHASEEVPEIDEIPLPGESGLGQAAREGVSAFNRSPYRRAIAGISKSLGDPLVSVVPLAGTRPDVVVTVAWDISWYQYRVDVSAGGSVRLEGRGDDPDDLSHQWRVWNANAASDGRVTLQ
ncbi:MAG TPA: hypothetical protein VGF46_01570 [Gaiellales bacterium]